MGWRFIDSFASLPSLVDRDGDSVPLSRDGDGHLWFDFDVTAAPSYGFDQSDVGLSVGDAQVGDGAWADVPFDGTSETRATAVPTHTTLRPRRPGGAGPGFTWPVVPPAGWSSVGSSATTGPAQTRKAADGGESRVGVPAKAGASASGVATGVQADGTPSTATATDKGATQETSELPDDAGFKAEMAPHPATNAVASAERTTHLEDEQAVRLQAKFENYRFYHEAFNHRDSTVQALIDGGPISNTARPPGFS